MANSGVYTVTLQPADSFTGSVPITVISVAEDISINVSQGQTFSLTISTLGQQAVASFDVNEGETLTVTATTTELVSGTATLPEIKSPDGVQRLQIFGSRTFTAEASRIHTITIAPAQADNFTGTIEFEIR